MNENSWETASIATTSSANDCSTPKDDFGSRLTRLEEEVNSILHNSQQSNLAGSLEGDYAVSPLAEKAQLTGYRWVPPHLRVVRQQPQPFADLRTGANELERRAGDRHSPTISFSGESDTVIEKKGLDAINDKEDTSTTTLGPAVRAVEHHPIAGKTFIIRTRQEPHRILTLTNGALEFLSRPFPSSGIFWQCVTTEGWYGFKNTVSGTYLGHDSKGKIFAKVSHHRAHEYFTAVRHEDGGYVLLNRHDNELLQMAISKDGKLLIEQKREGTAWDFIDTQHVCGSISLAYPHMSIEKLC